MSITTMVFSIFYKEVYEVLQLHASVSNTSVFELPEIKKERKIIQKKALYSNLLHFGGF